MPTGSTPSGGASAGAVRAGAAYVEAYLKDNKLVRGLEGLKRRLSNFGSAMMGMGRKSMIAGSLIALPLIGAAKHFADTGDQLNKMSQRTGVSVETLSQLGYAAGQSGASLEALGVGMKGMAKFTGNVAGGSKEAAKTLEDLGISVDSFMAASPEERFNMLADGIDGVKDASLRADAAMAVFGKSGDALLPMLEGGTAAIGALRKEADGLGKTVTKEQAENATKLGDAWDRVKGAVGAAVFAIGGALAPALELIAGHFKTAAVAVGDFLRENKALALIIGGVAVGLVAAGAASFVVGIALKGLALSVGIVSLAFKVLGVAIAFAFSPLGLIIGLVGGAVALFMTLTTSGRNFASSVGELFSNLASTATTAWGGIVAAVGKGDLELAGQIAMQGLRTAWAQMVVFMQKTWNNFKGFWVDGWHDMLAGVKLIGIDIALWWDMLWIGLFNRFKNTFTAVLKPMIAVHKAFDKEGGEALEFLLDVANKGMMGDIFEGMAQKKRDKILAELAAKKEEARKFRDAGMAGAEAAANIEAAELQRLVNLAKQVADGGGGIEELPHPRDIPNVPTPDEVGTRIRGMFQSPNWQQQFAVGDKINEKHLKVAEKQAKVAELQLQAEQAIEKAIKGAGVFRIK